LAKVAVPVGGSASRSSADAAQQELPCECSHIHANIQRSLFGMQMSVRASVSKKIS
jgi:hypothetical protein